MRVGMTSQFVGGGGAPFPPWDYRLDSIKTNKSYTQYIDTLLPASGGYRQTCSVIYHSFDHEGSKKKSNVLSSADDSTGALRFGLSTTPNPFFQIQWGAGSGYVQLNAPVAGTRYNIDCTLINGSQSFIVNGTTMLNQSNTGLSWKDSPTIRMFDYVGSAAGRIADLTIYGETCFYRYGESTLTAQIIPCVKEGEVCFYDPVRDMFMYNLGDGSFIGGTPVNDDGTAPL